MTMTTQANSKKPKGKGRALTSEAVGRKYGFRSGLEKKISDQLQGEGQEVWYEVYVIPYTKPAQNTQYTPDFILSNGIIIESKGRFLTADRQKMKFIKQQWPRLDIRFVFSNSRQRISKNSPTSYGMWCEKQGFDYAEGCIPREWIMEEDNEESLQDIARLTRKDKK